MPIKLRSTNLETATARLRLDKQKKPFWVKLSPGVYLGYRRLDAAGSWSVRAPDGKGAAWTQKFADADDYAEAVPPTVLSFAQAQVEAMKLARGDNATTDTSKPTTVDMALVLYKDELTANGLNVYNETGVRYHCTAALLARPVALLAAVELKAWRDDLATKMKRSSVNRLLSSMIRALSLAAKFDSRIQNADARKLGLEKLGDATADRNVILPDHTIIAWIDQAYRHDADLGLYVDMLAETGARPNQAARVLVSDLRCGAKPVLTVPKSGKGGGKNRAARKTQRTPVPISPMLARKLQAAAKGRAPNEPLMLQSDGKPWGKSRDYARDIAKVVKAIGLDEKEVTLYALRHSSIVRHLLKATSSPKMIADAHDTSITMLARHYSRYLINHGDEQLRAALLVREPQLAIAA